MLQKQTVFILGAGASVPYGYPSGAELVRRIAADPLQSDTTLDHDDYRKFKTSLAKSPFPSVDAFLEQCDKDVRDIGKRAIAEWLIRSENPQLFVRGQQIGQDDWYRVLFARLFAGVPFHEIPMLPVSFITFNYDRSLEYYLVDCLTWYGGKERSEAEVADIVTRISISHVYGDLGPLPFEKRTGVPSRQYANTITPEIVEQAASQIVTIHDLRASAPSFYTIRQRIGEAERRYFLGFGYHEENMSRLGFGKSPIEAFGTAVGLSSQRMQRLHNLYSGLNLNGDFVGCGQFIANHPTFLEG